MRGNDRGTSILSFHINEITQTYCLFGLKRDKKTKKIQNSVESKDVFVTPPAYEIADASTDTSYNIKITSFDYNKHNSCSCDTVPESIEHRNYIKPTVNMHGDTKIENKSPALPQTIQKKNKIKGKKEISFKDDSVEQLKNNISKTKHYKQSDPVKNDNVPRQKSKRTYKVTNPKNEKFQPGVDKCDPCEPKLVHEKSQTGFEGKKYLKKLKPESKKYNTYKCDKVLQAGVKFEIKPQNAKFYHGGPCSDAYSKPEIPSSVDNIVKSKGNKKKTDVKRKQKNKVTCLCHAPKLNKHEQVENVFAEGQKPNQKMCKEGVCVEALKHKDLSFVCKCKKRKQKKEINECTDISCNISNESKTNESNSTIVKLRKKISCLCRKYSQNIKEKRHTVATNVSLNEEACVKGLCREALEKHNKAFKCLCKKTIKECTDETCDLKKSNLKTITPKKSKKQDNEILKSTEEKEEACDKDCDIETTKSIFEKFCEKCRSRDARTSKNVRQPLDTKKVTSAKSKIVSKIKSKSENWTRHKKTSKRELNTSSVENQCRAMMYLQLSSAQQKAGDRLKTNQRSSVCHCKNCKAKKRTPVCHCKNCKPKQRTPVCYCKNCKKRIKVEHKQPNEVIKGDSERGDVLCNKSSGNVLKTGFYGVKTNLLRKKEEKKPSELIKDTSECGDVLCDKHSSNVSTGPCGVCCKCKKKQNMISKCQSFICTSFANLKRKRKTQKVETVTEHKGSAKNKVLLRKKEEKKPSEVIKNTSECGDVLCDKHSSNESTGPCGVCCKCKKKQNMISKCQSFICTSFANLKRKRKTQKVETVTKQQGLAKNKVPIKSSKTQKKPESICKCHHECQCDLALKKDALKKKKSVKVKPKVKPKAKKKPKKKKVPDTKKAEKQKLSKKKASDKRKQRSQSNKKLMQSMKGDEKFNRQVRRKERAEKKKQMKVQKQQIKELERLSEGKEQMQETSCLADFFLGIAKAAFNVMKTLALVMFKLITKPKSSFRYIKLRAKDPLGTYERIRKWACDSWQLKKLEMAKTVGGSDTMSILGDTLKETTVFQAFANKGKTKKERQLIEQENVSRKKRIKKRHDEAVYGCKHILLTTLRKTPCMWAYHVCPGFYPQCLSLLAFWSKFSNMMLFCLAFAVWTPCILLCELCRGLMCCTLCMG